MVQRRQGLSYELNRCLSRGCGLFHLPPPHRRQEILEMRVGIMRARRRFGVVLDGKQRKCFVPKTFDRSVVEIEVGDLQIGGSRHPRIATLYRKTMVLRCDEDLA